MTEIFAVSGGHTLGKTTLCHELSWELNRRGLGAGYIQEAVRRSQFMFKGDRGMKMHVETLLLHLMEEITASDVFDVLVCDRSAIDYLAYANVRFGRRFGETLYDTLHSAVSSYSRSYKLVFILKTAPLGDRHGNFRQGENTDSLTVSDECVALCKEFSVPFEVVELPPGSERSQLVLGSILKHLGHV